MRNNKQVNGSLDVVFIPCRINRESLGDGENAFVVLDELLDFSERPAWVPRKYIYVRQQAMKNGRLSAWVVGTELGRNKKFFKVAIINNGKPEEIKVKLSAVFSLEEVNKEIANSTSQMPNFSELKRLEPVSV